MTDFARQVIDRACRRKHVYETIGEAKAAARRANNEVAARVGVQVSRLPVGQQVRAYRCPFGDGTRAHAHFHTGHVPSLSSLEEIARAIREAHQPEMADA